MHLQDEARASPLRAQALVDRDHRDLDDVRVRALHDEVHRDALAEAARLPVRRPELGNGSPPPEQARHVAVLRRLHDRARDERLHEREAREVRVDVGLRLLLRDVEVLGEPEGGDPVDDPEVDHLRDVPLVLRERRRILARAPRLPSPCGCPRRARTPRAASARRRRARGCAARSASSRRRAGDARAPRRRRSGSRGRARCGSGSPAGSGSTSRGGRSRPRSG